MKYFGLLWAGLFRKRARTILTMASLVVAFLLFGLLQAVQSAFVAGVDVSNAGRLITNGRYSIIDLLPISHAQRIAATPGVEAVTHATWFGGQYQDPANFFPKFPVEPEAYLDLYPEIMLSAAQREAFINTRTGVVVAKGLADRFQWSIGDRIPIIADIWQGKDGNTWQFDLVGIYELPEDSNLGDSMLINYSYFDENRAGAQGQVGWFISRMSDPNQAGEVAAAIDQQFLNSNNETKSATEQEFFLSFAKQIGNIGLIVAAILGAVFFTIVLVTGNTMSQAVRERIPELAVLKTLGFSNQKVLALVLSESVLLSLIGGGIGLLIAFVL
ncbi:MAG: ABC transporter permease, partial [Xanthomonadales bacterium]|nr:ABC transporter permease [Xanthomonadales bacterium]